MGGSSSCDRLYQPLDKCHMPLPTPHIFAYPFALLCRLLHPSTEIMCRSVLPPLPASVTTSSISDKPILRATPDQEESLLNRGRDTGKYGRPSNPPWINADHFFQTRTGFGRNPARANGLKLMACVSNSTGTGARKKAIPDSVTRFPTHYRLGGRGRRHSFPLPHHIEKTNFRHQAVPRYVSPPATNTTSQSRATTHSPTPSRSITTLTTRGFVISIF